MDEAGTGKVASFARARNPGTTHAELRVGHVPVEILDCLDGVSLGRGQHDRGPLVIEILKEWADKQMHAHTVFQRVVFGNPSRPESQEQRA